MTLSISLTPQLESMVRAKISSGMYSSASEVVREALRLLDEYDQLRGKRLETLRQDIQAGLERGERQPTTAQNVFQRVRAKKRAAKNG